MQTICTSLQTDNHANTSSLNFYGPDALLLTPNQQRQSTEGKDRLAAKWNSYISSMQRSRLHDGTYALRVNNQRGSEVRISGERQLDDADLVLEHERHEPLAVLSTSRRQHQQPSTAPRSVVIVENLRRENSVFSMGPEISAWAPSHEGRTYQMRCMWIFDAILACFFSTCTCVLLMITYSKHTQCHKRSSLCSCAFYDLGGAETLFANNQMYRNTVALRSKAL